MRLFCRHHWKYKHTFAIDGRVYVYNDLYVGEEYDAHGH
jgi:hypothetical protein